MLSSAHADKKRSMRALECSGPWPSKPWGSSSDRLLCWPHLSAAATMNWSITIWAPFAKSPNCASQHTSASDATERDVLALTLPADQHAVTLAERPPPGVLAGEAHRHAGDEQRPERQRLA